MKRKAAVVPEEVELGPQRRCTRCGDYWPADPEFFYTRRHGTELHSWCRACWGEWHRERRAALAS